MQTQQDQEKGNMIALGLFMNGRGLRINGNIIIPLKRRISWAIRQAHGKLGIL